MGMTRRKQNGDILDRDRARSGAGYPSKAKAPRRTGATRGDLKTDLKNPLGALALNRSAAPEEEGSEPSQSYEAEGYGTGLRDG